MQEAPTESAIGNSRQSAIGDALVSRDTLARCFHSCIGLDGFHDHSQVGHFDQNRNVPIRLLLLSTWVRVIRLLEPQPQMQ